MLQSCLCAEAGSLDVCFGYRSGKYDCYTAIDGLAWSNYGLTYMERAQRMATYLVTGVVPERNLIFLGHHTPTLTATDKGRYVLVHKYIHMQHFTEIVNATFRFSNVQQCAAVISRSAMTYVVLLLLVVATRIRLIVYSNKSCVVAKFMLCY